MNKLEKAFYRITFVYNGETYKKDLIAFDIGVSHPHCLTLILLSAGRLILDMDGLESYVIEPLFNIY